MIVFFIYLSCLKAIFLFTKVGFKFSAIFSARACTDVFPRCSSGGSPDENKACAYSKATVTSL